MIPYFVLILLPLLIGLVSQKYRVTMGDKIVYRTDSVSIDVFMVIFLLLLMLRGLQCGNDTKQYQFLYEEYSSRSFLALFEDYDHEFGYKLLNKLVDVISGNYQILLCITSVISVYPLWFFYRSESEKPVLTMALFLLIAPFVMYFSGIRQSMTMGAGVLAWYAAKEKKIIWFIAIIVLAMQFHNSAIVLLAMYPIYHAKITKKWLWGVIPCIVVIYFYRVPIFAFLVRYLWQEYTLTSATGATSVLLLLVLFGIYSYVIPNEKTLDPDTVAMRNMLMLSIAIQCFAPVHPLAMRMNYYFLIFIPILIPKIVNSSRIRFAKIAKMSVIILEAYSFYYFIDMVIRDKDPLNIIPYIPFWKN